MLSFFHEDDRVPAEIQLMSDKTSVALYLKLLESGSEKKRDTRLVIVGEKGAGKTSLIKRLFGEEIGVVTSTNGIVIHKIKCNADADDGVWTKLEGIVFFFNFHTAVFFLCQKIQIKSLELR